MRLLAAADVHTVVVEIGAIPVRVVTDDASFLATIRSRYEGFLGSEDAAFELVIELTPPGRVSNEEDVRVTQASGRWVAERADFHFEWDPRRRDAHVRQSANPYSLDGVLRIMHTLILASRGGFLLHAASAVRNGRAFLFFGRSGAGKTTMSRLAPADATLLTDEISYVRRGHDTYIAHGTPFTGELAKLGENISAPIAGFYHLVQAPKNSLSVMKPADAAGALLESVLFFAEDRDLVTQVFQSVCDVILRIPIYKLEFQRDKRVWDLLQ